MHDGPLLAGSSVYPFNANVVRAFQLQMQHHETSRDNILCNHSLVTDAVRVDPRVIAGL